MKWMSSSATVHGVSSGCFQLRQNFYTTLTREKTNLKFSRIIRIIQYYPSLYKTTRNIQIQIWSLYISVVILNRRSTCIISIIFKKKYKKLLAFF